MMVQKFPGVLFLFFVVSLMYVNVDAAKWDYNSTKYGVEAWPTKFAPWCNGTRQSPIDIKHAYYDNSLGDIHFTNYHATPSNVLYTAKNDGHTYSVSFSGYTNASHPKINGGGLPNYFKLVGFHFHWGKNNSQGSEHLVDGMAYPAELHLVHLNMKYPNVSSGVKYGDGLAVLGVFIKEGKYNANFQFLNLTKYNVTEQEMASNISLSSLMGLLPSNKTFYRYNGSLTTPYCQEAVIWTVFSNYIEVSEEQLNALRGLKHVDTMNKTLALVDNFRPPQALNGRRVLAYVHQPSVVTTSPTTQDMTPTSTMTATSTVNTTQKMPTTPDGAYRVSDSYAMLLATFCLVLPSFLEI